MRRWLLRPLLVVLSVAIGIAAAPAPLTVRDVDGRAWTPLFPAAGETNLLFFIASDCPISSHYAPEIDRIAASYRDRRVRAFLIYAAAGIDAGLGPVLDLLGPLRGHRDEAELAVHVLGKDQLRRRMQHLISPCVC